MYDAILNDYTDMVLCSVTILGNVEENISKIHTIFNKHERCYEFVRIFVVSVLSEYHDKV